MAYTPSILAENKRAEKRVDKIIADVLAEPVISDEINSLDAAQRSIILIHFMLDDVNNQRTTYTQKVEIADYAFRKGVRLTGLREKDNKILADLVLTLELSELVEKMRKEYL